MPSKVTTLENTNRTWCPERQIGAGGIVRLFALFAYFIWGSIREFRAGS
jgi:hypothetical protein